MKYVIYLLCLLFAANVCAAERPNILLLMAEDLSPRIGAFGDKVAVTPNLDKLASQGVRYTNTFTASGVCAPSRAAIITGMHAESFGGQHMRAYTEGPAKYYAVPQTDVKAFPELLRAAGYYTFNRNKLDYQFSNVRSGSGPFTIWDDDSSGEVDFTSLPKNKPFFGYVNYIGTHESGLFYKDRFPTSLGEIYTSIKQTMIHWDTEERVKPEDVTVPPYYPDTPLVRKDIARQYNNLITVDRQIGQLLEALDKSGLAQDTIVIWSTDHGDGLPRAKRELYDSGLHVPMIIRWPEKWKPADIEIGGASDRLISGVDFAPTILSLAGAALPSYLQGKAFNKNVSPEEQRQYVFASRDRIGNRPDRQRAVRDKRFKYIRSYNQQAGGFHLPYRDNLDSMQELWRLLEEGALNEHQQQWFKDRPEEMLFDTQVDPHELNNLVDDPQYADTLARLRQAYSHHQQRIIDLSDESEARMAQRFWPEGKQPRTSAPVFELHDNHLAISSRSEGASIGYRINDGPWRLYTESLILDAGDKVESKAVRYGWKESPVAEMTF
ncbi:sulfatase-like hydrolase/transferase [Maricurvus nonylphenolicus]|uniref:sulfatase family protein n=1 Tax=Maricurvus nonylphenolicus TaxID=1008307 RepID=UPI0036F273AE